MVLSIRETRIVFTLVQTKSCLQGNEFVVNKAEAFWRNENIEFLKPATKIKTTREGIIIAFALIN